MQAVTGDVTQAPRTLRTRGHAAARARRRPATDSLLCVIRRHGRKRSLLVDLSVWCDWARRQIAGQLRRCQAVRKPLCLLPQAEEVAGPR